MPPSAPPKKTPEYLEVKCMVKPQLGHGHKIEQVFNVTDLTSLGSDSEDLQLNSLPKQQTREKWCATSARMLLFLVDRSLVAM